MEVLIVVAVVAILALLAVPNILEARARARISQSIMEMHAVAIAIEAYHHDNGAYPTKLPQELPPGVQVADPSSSSLRSWVPQSPTLDGISITTPVAYISAVPQDPFNVRSGVTNEVPGAHPVKTYRYFRIVSPPVDERTSMKAGGSDIDKSYFGDATLGIGRRYGRWYIQGFGPDRDEDAPGFGPVYDPTNGTTSNGDIVITQRDSLED